MKKLFYLITAAAMMASFASCGKIDHGNAPTEEPTIETPSTDGTTTLTISAHTPQLKTYLSGGSTKWVKGDLITVFAEDGTSAKSDAVSEAQDDYNFKFAGWTTGMTPKYALAVGPQSYYDLYTVSYEDGLINATLRTSQVLYHTNSFSKLANIGVGEVVYAEGTGYKTDMKNLCGLIKFQVEGKNVEKVKISELDGKSLTGEVQIGMDENGNPEVQSVLNGRSYVEISATSSKNLNENSGMLPHGADIYACVLPGEYRIKVESYAEGGELLNTLTLKAGSVMEVNRSEIATIGNENTTIKVDTFKPTTEGDEGEGEVEDIVLTLDFASWPFIEEKVSSARKTDGDGDELTFTQDDVTYSVNVKNQLGGYYHTSGNLRCNNGVNEGDLLMTLPGIENYRLASAIVRVGNTPSYNEDGSIKAQNSKYINLKSEQSNADCTINSLNGDTELVLSRSGAGEACTISSKGKNFLLNKLVLRYTYVAPASAE